MIEDDAVDEFIAAARKVKDCKAALADAEESRDKLKGPLLEAFVNGGTGSVKKGRVTVHTHSQGYAGSVDRAKAVAALEAAGLDEYVGVNTQSLSSFFRDHGANDDSRAAIESVGLDPALFVFNVKHDLRVKGL